MFTLKIVGIFRPGFKWSFDMGAGSLIPESKFDIDQELNGIWEQAKSTFIFPDKKGHPYYISAPHWRHSSAGIRALYLLCHALNQKGYDAYITNHPYGEYARFHPWTNTELMAPMLSEQKANEHFERGLTPILLYPEVVSGNPLKAPVVVRWVMNFPGHLGGESSYDVSEICFGYSKELARAAGFPDQVLHLPTVDTRIFHPGAPGVVRKGGCFFASKYKHVHHGKLYSVTADCFEITRQWPDSLTPPEIADLLRRSEVFYAYENTALATEAVLCGCPAVFIPNPYLKAIIGREELGADGYAWGTDSQEIERARASVPQGVVNYLETYDLFWSQLSHFVEVTQRRASSVSYRERLEMPSWPVLPVQACSLPVEPPPALWVDRRKGLRRYLHRIERFVRPFVRKNKQLAITLWRKM